MTAVMNIFIAAGSAAAVVATVGGFIGRQAAAWRPLTRHGLQGHSRISRKDP
jgi:hypothetical protein